MIAWADLGLDLSQRSLIARRNRREDADTIKAFLRATTPWRD